MRLKHLIIAMMLLPLVFASTRTVTLTNADVTDDVSVLQSNPTSRVNTGTMYVGYYDSSIKEYRSYFIWDISDLPSGTSAVYDAQFYWNFYNEGFDGSAGQTIYLTHVKDLTWDGQTESTMTWNNQVCGTGFNDAVDCNLTVTDSVYYTFGDYVGEPTYNITEIVQYALANSQSEISFAMNDSEEDNPYEFLYFSSSEDASPITITITYENVAPNTTQARVSPLIAYDNQNLYGYCTGEDLDGDNVGYYWKWFVNSTLYDSGYNGTYVSGVETKVSTITPNNTHTADNWTFSCLATDTELNSTWLNSSVVGVQTFYFDDCLLADNVTMTIRQYYEEVPLELLNYSLVIEGTYWFASQPETTQEFHLNYTGNHTYHLCIFPDNTTVQADVYLKNTVEDAYTHRYYLYNHSFYTNNTLDLNLYNYKNTSLTEDVIITARQRNYDYFTDVVVKMQRNYIDEGIWRTVQMDKSDDFGTLIFHAKEQSEDYRFLFYDTNNCLLYTSKTTKFLCTTGTCELTVLLDECVDLELENELEVDIQYNNITGIVNVTWDDAQSIVSSIQMLVTRETFLGSTIICNNTVAAPAGYQTCNISAYDGTIKVAVTYTASPEHPKVVEYIIKVVNQLKDLLPLKEQVFWSFGIILVVVCFAMFSPVGAILSSIVGLLFVWYLGLLSGLTTTIIMSVIILGVVIAIKVKN